MGVSETSDFLTDVVVVGGCGRVGLPLAITLADSGLRVTILDVDHSALAEVASGRMPFSEPGAAPVLERVITAGLLRATSRPDVIAESEVVVIAVGTPIDSSGTPDSFAIDLASQACQENLRNGQLIVLRSTVFPGSTARLEQTLRGGADIDVVYCPERIAEGNAMFELKELPQIIGSRNERSRERAAGLFQKLGTTAVHLNPEEAEFAKLAANAWRYASFAIANELYMMATIRGLDFGHIRESLQHGYPRAAGLPSAGLTAGPCLPKDTAQLAALPGLTFDVGTAALKVNSGLPVFLVERLAAIRSLEGAKVGVLGTAFKQDSDDVRDSLAQVVVAELTDRGALPLCTDPYVNDRRLLPLDKVLDLAEVLFVATPHSEYRGLEVNVPFIDIWNILSSSSCD